MSVLSDIRSSLPSGLFLLKLISVTLLGSTYAKLAMDKEVGTTSHLIEGLNLFGSNEK